MTKRQRVKAEQAVVLIKRGFMDGIDWQHHLEADPKGVKVYPSVDTTRRGEPCLAKGAGCGIVEIEIRLVRWGLL